MVVEVVRIVQPGSHDIAFVDPATYHPWVVGAPIGGEGPKKHEGDKHARYRTHNDHGDRILPFGLTAVAISTLGGVGPEGTRGLRRLLRKARGGAAAVIPRIGRAVVFWATRAILDAHGIGGHAARTA